MATNILAHRLRKLEAVGIITAEAGETDRRMVNYRLTEKGIDLAPVLLELLIWGARHEKTEAPRALIEQMEKDRERILAEVRRRWRERDPAPSASWGTVALALIEKQPAGGLTSSFARVNQGEVLMELLQIPISRIY
jgi:DNA-binding HxlR family transcriptional regulator